LSPGGCRSIGHFPGVLQVAVPATFVVSVSTPAVRVTLTKSKIGTTAELRI